jgi:cupin fold WbuC family metalloprotein
MFILIFAILLVIYYIQNYKEVPIGTSSSSVILSANDLINISSDSNVKVIGSSFSKLIEEARKSPRKRIMTDITKNPKENSMQVLINTWTDGSYSPIHYHPEYSEVFSILEGALAFFTFTNDGEATCHILSSKGDADRAIVVEKQQFHGMTAAPAIMGYPGFAIVFENSGHTFNPSKKTKYTANWAPVIHQEWGIDGDPKYFEEILKKCPPSPNK